MALTFQVPWAFVEEPTQSLKPLTVAIRVRGWALGTSVSSFFHMFSPPLLSAFVSHPPSARLTWGCFSVLWGGWGSRRPQPVSAERCTFETSRLSQVFVRANRERRMPSGFQLPRAL